MEQPFILCGLGRVGGRVLEYLRAAGLPVVVVDTSCAADDPRVQGLRVVTGDCRRREVLEAAGIARARGVLILTSADLVNLAAAFMVRNLNRDVRVVIRVFNQNLISRLGSAVHNVCALSTSTLTAPLLALTALTGQALGAFRLPGVPHGRRQIIELTVVPGSPLRGRQIGPALARHDALAVAHFPARGGERFLLQVDPETVLQPGDRLVVGGEPHQLGHLLAEGGDEILPHVLWAGWLRRMGRVAWRTLAEVDLAVKIATGVLVGVIVSSTLVFHVSVHKYSLADAFFRTISVMATGGDMHAEDFDLPWQKVFAASLRIVGAALTAAFTAIVTNYLLRARLGGALEVRRIPDSGHVIVCGLGNIGFRVVEELVHCDERVVVIERDRDGRFVATTRRLGVPVIIGDATVREVLRQAHALTARAVVAATSDDLMNIEVALLVREMSPSKRVVLRLGDPHLAQTLREAADVRLALSVPTLAAPAFVAALFNDRVVSVFLVGSRLLAVVEITVSEGDDFLVGRSVRELAVDYQTAPLAVIGPGNVLRPAPLHHCLEPGDRLTAIAALSDLERLLRREAAAKDYAVEVMSVPAPARPAVVTYLCQRQGITAEEADRALEHLPLRLREGMTRGQAEALLATLHRDQVEARLCQRAEAAMPLEQGNRAPGVLP